MPRPLVAVACALAAGAAVGGDLPSGAAVFLSVFGLALLGLCLGASARLRTTGAWAAALALGAAAAAVEGRQYDAASLRVWIASYPDAGPVRLRGVCHADPREAEGRWILIVDVHDLGGRHVAGRARIDVGGTASQ